MGKIPKLDLGHWVRPCKLWTAHGETGPEVRHALTSPALCWAWAHLCLEDPLPWLCIRVSSSCQATCQVLVPPRILVPDSPKGVPSPWRLVRLHDRASVSLRISLFYVWDAAQGVLVVQSEAASAAFILHSSLADYYLPANLHARTLGRGFRLMSLSWDHSWVLWSPESNGPRKAKAGG